MELSGDVAAVDLWTTLGKQPVNRFVQRSFLKSTGPDVLPHHCPAPPAMPGPALLLTGPLEPQLFPVSHKGRDRAVKGMPVPET